METREKRTHAFWCVRVFRGSLQALGRERKKGLCGTIEEIFFPRMKTLAFSFAFGWQHIIIEILGENMWLDRGTSALSDRALSLSLFLTYVQKSGEKRRSGKESSVVERTPPWWHFATTKKILGTGSDSKVKKMWRVALSVPKINAIIRQCPKLVTSLSPHRWKKEEPSSISFLGLQPRENDGRCTSSFKETVGFVLSFRLVFSKDELFWQVIITPACLVCPGKKCPKGHFGNINSFFMPWW